MFATVEQGGKVYTDQVGRFPVTYIHVTKYFFVMYVYDANAIVIEPLKDRSGKEILRAYKKWYDHLKARGFQPKTLA